MSMETFFEVLAPPRTACYASLVTARFVETWEFYTEFLGFRTHREGGGFVHLVHPDGAQLGLLAEETNEDWPELVSAVQGRGFWLSLEVSDLEELRERLAGLGIPLLYPVSGHVAGDGFMVRDPNGVLISVVRSDRVIGEQAQ